MVDRTSLRSLQQGRLLNSFPSPSVPCSATTTPFSPAHRDKHGRDGLNARAGGTCSRRRKRLSALACCAVIYHTASDAVVKILTRLSRVVLNIFSGAPCCLLRELRHRAFFSLRLRAELARHPLPYFQRVNLWRPAPSATLLHHRFCSGGHGTALCGKGALPAIPSLHAHLWRKHTACNLYAVYHMLTSLSYILCRNSVLAWQHWLEKRRGTPHGFSLACHYCSSLSSYKGRLAK